jgi:NAD(P)-dependent dehydrogenase (short-subunit alcohol dehydrogenase family)
VTDRLTDKVAVVTGAALGGIGGATAIVLAAEGAKVCCADIDVEGAHQTAKEIKQAGGEAFATYVDVTKADSNAAMVKATLERYGALQVAHLNAGIVRSADFLDLSERDWDLVIAVNLRGVFLGMQAAGRSIAAAGGGSIIVTASAAGLVGLQTASAYCASKFGVVGLVKSAAMDLAKHKVRVNAVCPGNIDTKMLGPGHGDPEVRMLLARGHALGRVGEPEEIAHAVAFLASDDAAFITATTLSVDGGLVGGMDPPWRQPQRGSN